MLTATTELEAVNALLMSIGEAPVNSLDSGLDDALIAKITLDEVSRTVQKHGWYFNTEDGFPIKSNIDKELVVPKNILKLDMQDTRYVLRGRRVYDRQKHTFKIEKDLKATVIIALDFEDLPESARQAIMYRAARIFQNRVVGSQVIYSFTKEDEATAMAELQSEELEAGNYTIFDSADAQRMLNTSPSTPVYRSLAGSHGGHIYE